MRYILVRKRREQKLVHCNAGRRPPGSTKPEAPCFMCFGKQLIWLHEGVQKYQMRSLKNVALDDDVFVVQVPQCMRTLSAVGCHRVELLRYLAMQFCDIEGNDMLEG